MFSSRISPRSPDLISFNDTPSMNISFGNSAKQPSPTVNELNVYHLATSEQLELVKGIVSDYSTAGNLTERNKVSEKITALTNEISQTRRETFHVPEEYDENAPGQLATGKNENDRDSYIRLLATFNLLKKEINDVREEQGFAKCDVDASLYFNHASSIYGDLQALNKLLNSNSYNSGMYSVPDLGYNRGDLQFG